MQSPQERNNQVFTEISALIQRVWYGDINVSFKVHNGRITKMEAVIGKKTVYDLKQGEEKPLKDLLDRVRKENEFTVKIGTKSGKLHSIYTKDTLQRDYDQLDSCS